MTAKEQGLPPLPPIPAGPLYQAIILDGNCTAEFVEYVQAYALAALASDTGERGVVTPRELLADALMAVGCEGAGYSVRHGQESRSNLLYEAALRAIEAALRAQPAGGGEGK